jgi:hypothetical protein
MWKYLCLIILSLTSWGQSALTLVTRETFQGIGTLNSTTPGNLGTVTGSFLKRACGPSVVGDTSANGYGWSADIQRTQASHYYAPSNSLGAAYQGMICGWYYWGSLYTDGDLGRRNALLQCKQSNGSNIIAIAMDYRGYVYLGGSSDYSVQLSTPFDLPTGQWVYFCLAWKYSNGYDNNDYVAYYKTLSGNMTQIGTVQTAGGSQNTIYHVGGQSSVTGGQMVREIRYGAASRYNLSLITDASIYPSDMPTPSNARRHWYVNTAAGNDANDGTTATTAWATAAKINTESANLGLFPGATYSTGDILHLDCSTPLPVLTTPIQIKTNGLTILQTGGALDPLKTITSSWAPVPGAVKVYSTNNGGDADMLSTVLFEDGKYLNHPTGANFIAVQNALVSTPGSFWTDGTTMYLHPFGDTDPRSDGKIYRRTRNRGRATLLNADSVVVIQAKDVWWDGLICSGTTLARMTDNYSLGAYCFQWESGAGGTNLLSNFNVSKYSKHAIGATISGNNGIFERRDGVYSQSTPYAIGGASTDVDYCAAGLGSNSGNQGIYLRCNESVNNVGLIGSATGTNNVNAGSYYSHGQTVGNFSLVSFTDCVWQGGMAEEGVISQINLLKTTAAYATFNTSATFNQCKSTAGMLGTASGNLVLRNSILKTGNAPGQAYFSVLPPGSTTVEGCTIDLRATTGGGAKAVWGRISPISNLTIRNVFLIGSSNDTRAMLTGFSNTDTINLSHNAYDIDGGYVSLNYNDGNQISDRTFLQWQSLGFDAGSLETNFITSLGSNYNPITGSTLIDAGVNLGPLTDYAGATIFNLRNDIGAYEGTPLTPLEVWRRNYFNSTLNEGISADYSVNADDGLPNLLKYALGLNPWIPSVNPINLSTTTGYLRITIPKNSLATDISYSVEATGNLSFGQWTTIGTTIESNTSTLLQVRDNNQISAASSRFLRLKITRL